MVEREVTNGTTQIQPETRLYFDVMGNVVMTVAAGRKEPRGKQIGRILQQVNRCLLAGRAPLE